MTNEEKKVFFELKGFSERDAEYLSSCSGTQDVDYGYLRSDTNPNAIASDFEQITWIAAYAEKRVEGERKSIIAFLESLEGQKPRVDLATAIWNLKQNADTPKEEIS